MTSFTLLLLGRQQLRVSFYSLFQCHSFRAQVLSNLTQGDNKIDTEVNANPVSVSIMETEKYFHLFCKQQLEQSEVVLPAVLSCHSSGKGSKEQGDKALETSAENVPNQI